MKQKFIMRSLLLLLVMGAVIFGVKGNTASAVVGDTFIVGDLKYQITAEPAGGADGTVSVSCNSSTVTSYSIPEKVQNNVNTYDVTAIADNAFIGNNAVTNITIPDSVTSIGSSTFFNCPNLQEITIPDSVTSIGSRAFSTDKVLKNVTLSKNITAIPDKIFAGCTNLNSILIPDNVTTIGDSAFDSCTSITSISIPNNVQTIGVSAFGGCEHLETINIPDKIQRIPGYAFLNCKSIKSISIPSNVTVIGQGAFQGCTGLADITIPGKVTEIGASAFKGCTGFTSIAIPDSVTVINGSAFQGCIGLKNITLSKNINSVSTSIFQGCIGLTNVTIPESVTAIGALAFQDCTGLSSITFLRTLCPTFNTDVFRNVPDGLKVYVPSSDLQSYKSVTGVFPANSVVDTNPAEPFGISSVKASNGAVSIVLNKVPTDSMSGDDFSATIQIDAGITGNLSLKSSSFTWNAETRTVSCSFTPIAQTASSQSVIICVSYKGAASVAAPAFLVAAQTPPTVTASISSVSASNGTVSIVLDRVPTDTPAAGHFSATRQINGGTASNLSLDSNSFKWDAATTTVSYSFTPISQTASSQSVVIGVSYKGAASVSATPYTIAALTPLPPTVVTVSGISVNIATMTLIIGGANGVLTANVKPDNATNKGVTWSSSNLGVATVSDGVVTPVSQGTVTITAKTVDGGYTANCAVTVNPVNVPQLPTPINQGSRDRDKGNSSNNSGIVTQPAAVSVPAVTTPVAQTGALASPAVDNVVPAQSASQQQNSPNVQLSSASAPNTAQSIEPYISEVQFSPTVMEVSDSVKEALKSGTHTPEELRRLQSAVASKMDQMSAISVSGKTAKADVQMAKVLKARIDITNMFKAAGSPISALKNTLVVNAEPIVGTLFVLDSNMLKDMKSTGIVRIEVHAGNIRTIIPLNLKAYTGAKSITFSLIKKKSKLSPSLIKR